VATERGALNPEIVACQQIHHKRNPERLAVRRDRTGRPYTMATFPPETLHELRDRKEVAIRTEKHPGSAITIWVVVPDSDVLVRSVRGGKGRWFRDLAGGGPATLEFNGQRLVVQAVPATDADSIERASRAFLSKYRSSPYAESIVRPEVLQTTLRLEPR
jgi:hypothetical protein